LEKGAHIFSIRWWFIGRRLPDHPYRPARRVGCHYRSFLISVDGADIVPPRTNERVPA
jgi:hypothetical protein